MRTSALLVGLCLASAALAQGLTADPRHDVVPSPGMERLAGGTWLSRWNPATGTPRSIYGTGVQLSDWRENTLEEARRHAHLVLEEYGAVIGTTGASTFTEVIGQRMGNLWTFTFEQSFRGVPAIGGRADVRINHRGQLAMLGSTAWQIPADFSIAPRISAEQATAIAWLSLGAKPAGAPPRHFVRKPRLVIWGDVAATAQAPFDLAWEIPIANVDSNGDGTVGRYYVDAINRRVLRYETDRHDCGLPGCAAADHARAGTMARTRAPLSAAPLAAAQLATAPLIEAVVPSPLLPVPTTVTVMAWTRDGLSAIAPLNNIPLEGLVVPVPGVGNRTTDANGQFTIDIAAPTTISLTYLDGVRCAPISGASFPSHQVVVQPGVPATIQLLSAAATPAEAAHTTTLYWVREVNEWARTILGDTPQLALADAVTATVNIPLACNAWMILDTINFFGANGACNNMAFSTVIAHEWGHLIDYYYGGIFNNGGDGLSEGWGDLLAMYLVDNPALFQGFALNGASSRTGTNIRQFTSNTFGTGVHAAGETFMGFGWKLRENLRARLGTQQAIAVSENIVVSTLAANATNQPDAILEIQLADDNDANLLNGTPHHAEISAACDVHSLPYQGVLLGAITHTPLDHTTIPLTPRRVVATAVPVGGTFTEVRIVSGGTFQMLPTGVPDEYHALIGSANYNGLAFYHFEAIHSSGGTLRVPATGQFSYRVADVETIWADDLESGAVGWASSRVAVEDDWQLGAPNGRLGAGWVDPSRAYSGLHCFGNDLGMTTSTLVGDGAYSSWTESALRSPMINCAGYSGVRLRFRRWLSVAPGDRAWIEVNGTQVWTTGQVSDRGWQSIELLIPAADNNPAVQVSWHLDANSAIEAGGWAIDDVEVSGAGSAPPLPARLTFGPAQVRVSSPWAMLLFAPPARPFVLALGDTAGPTNVAGIPPLLVGGNVMALPGITNGFGFYQLITTSPPTAAASGTFLYSQAVALDASSNVIVSNQYINLIAP